MTQPTRQGVSTTPSHDQEDGGDRPPLPEAGAPSVDPAPSSGRGARPEIDQRSGSLVKLLRPPVRFLRRFVGGSRSELLPSWGNYLRMRPYALSMWFQTRRLKHALSRLLSNRPVHEMFEFDDEPDQEFRSGTVMPYNFQNEGTFHRVRTERMMNILRTVRGLDMKGSRVLCIGPRNEAEILLMSLYGFTLENITGVDLFSASPLIRVMDMHDLRLPDDSFDVVYSAYVMGYSDDIRKACSEMARVTRDGGLIAVGYGCGRTGVLTGTPLSGGLEELYSYFDGHVNYVYWREEYPKANGEIGTTTVFSIRK